MKKTKTTSPFRQASDEQFDTMYTRDENSTAMLDLIYSNRVYDLGDTLFCGTIRDGVFAGKFKQNHTDLQSTISSMTKKVEDTITAYVEAFGGAGNAQ